MIKYILGVFLTKEEAVAYVESNEAKADYNYLYSKTFITAIFCDEYNKAIHKT
jgi:hypothetical protein